jgi:hypothetical protein
MSGYVLYGDVDFWSQEKEMGQMIVAALIALHTLL